MIKTGDVRALIAYCYGRIDECDKRIFAPDSDYSVESKKLFFQVKSCYQEMVEPLEEMMRKEKNEIAAKQTATRRKTVDVGEVGKADPIHVDYRQGGGR